MNPLLAEGLTDAIGFVLGALVAYTLARMFGYDPLLQGMEGNTIVGIVMCGIGGGAGVQLARRFRAGRKKKDQ